MNYILWGISWPNLLMYSATIPKYNKKKDDEEVDDDDVELIPDSQIGAILGL